MPDAAELIYNNPTSGHTPAPQTIAPPSAAPQSVEEMAKAIYDAGRRSAPEDIYAKAERERREERQAQERRESEGRRSELKEAMADALKEQKPAEAPKTDGQPKTPEAIQADAAKLVTELQLDTSDPVAQPFATVATELGIGKDGAQKLIELNQQHAQKYWERQTEQWAAACTQEFTPADIGNAHLVTRFADDEARALLNGPYGNHPALVRMLSRAGAALRKAGVA